MNSDLSGPAVFMLIACLLCFSSCGKKGPLTLVSYEKPVAPSLLAAHHREDRIILSWTFPRDKEKEIAGFIVMKSSGDGFARLALTENHIRTFSDDDFKTGTTYGYKVLSRNFRGVLSDASNVVAITPSPAPVPPATIFFRVAGDSLELSWENAGEKVSYNIFRSFEKGVYAQAPLNASPLSGTIFRDVFFPNRQVYYTIRSLSQNLDEGPPSREFTVDPARFVPPAPQDFRCFATADSVYLSWQGSDAPWVKGFRVYRKFGAGEYELIGETEIPSFIDTDNLSGRRDYRVTAVGTSSEGPAAELLGECGKPD